jgi:hypothetical protein
VLASMFARLLVSTCRAPWCFGPWKGGLGTRYLPYLLGLATNSGSSTEHQRRSIDPHPEAQLFPACLSLPGLAWPCWSSPSSFSSIVLKLIHPLSHRLPPTHRPRLPISALATTTFSCSPSPFLTLYSCHSFLSAPYATPPAQLSAPRAGSLQLDAAAYESSGSSLVPEQLQLAVAKSLVLSWISDQLPTGLQLPVGDPKGAWGFNW